MEGKHNVNPKWKKRYIGAVGRLRLKILVGLEGILASDLRGFSGEVTFCFVKRQELEG